MKKMDGKDNVSSRQCAFNVLNRVAGGRAYADIALEGEITRVAREERPLATELTYGVLRNLGRLDWIIDAFSKVKARKLEHRVLNALRLGVYQLLLLSGVPPHAAINETVELVKRGGDRRRAGFVNAVLRKAASEGGKVGYPEAGSGKYLSVYYSHPEWMVRRWLGRYGPEFTEALLGADGTVPPKVIRVNTSAATRGGLAAELGRAGLTVEEARYSPAGLVVVGGGAGVISPGDPRYYIQDEGSQLVGFLLSPRPGERVLDACAAPGGKTTHLAELMEGRGRIFAVDRHPARLGLLARAAASLGHSIITPVAADSARLPLGEGVSFDSVLVDGPCSGLGVLRRSPDIKLRVAEGDIERLSILQSGILAQAARFVRRGGRLVYSVCTYEPEETDGVVGRFLEGGGAGEGFRVEDAGKALPKGCDGLVDGEGFMRTYPHLHGTDGFFAALLVRG